MTTIIAVTPCGDGPRVHDGVRDLLGEVDMEFVPPLSQRTDTLTLPSAVAVADGLGRYLAALERELWLVAVDDGRVVGLLSFLTDHQDPWLTPCSPSLYATTVAVSVRARRAGIGVHLYDAFEAAARQRAVPYLTTRTWTTNTAHLRLLRHRGFRQVAELRNHRQDGVGTVYLAYDVGLDRTAPRGITTRR